MKTNRCVGEPSGGEKVGTKTRGCKMWSIDRVGKG